MGQFVLHTLQGVDAWSFCSLEGERESSVGNRAWGLAPWSSGVRAASLTTLSREMGTHAHAASVTTQDTSSAVPACCQVDSACSSNSLFSGPTGPKLLFRKRAAPAVLPANPGTM